MTPAWNHPLSAGPRIPSAPIHFRGTIRRFVDEYLEPALPSPAAALAWHEAILAHAATPGTTLLVRMTEGHKQEAEVLAPSGRTLRMTDNAPPWWIHAAAFSGTGPPATGLAEILDDVWGWMFRAKPDHANAAGWYVAHILRAKPKGDGPIGTWSDGIAMQRFLRNMSPLNQFLVPKGNGSAIGERAVVIATIADWYRSRYGASFDDFLESAGIRGGEIGGPDWNAVIELAGGARNAPKAKSRTGTAAMRSVATAPGVSAGSAWARLLSSPASANDRVRILAAVPDATARLEQLTAGLTVEGFVGVVNALFNKADPRKLVLAAPSDVLEQSRLAWSHLQDAKLNPNLGGDWARTVSILKPGSALGLNAIEELSLDLFVASALSAVNKIYRNPEVKFEI